jgi:hypothetical protein
MPLLYCITEVRLIHFQILDLRKTREQFILDAVGKKSVLLFLAQIFQRQRQCCCHCRPAHPRAVLLQGLELFRKLRIADLIRVKVYHRDANAVFHFAFAETVQEGPPPFVFFEIFGNMLGKKNVPGISAGHYPLRHV